MAEKPSLGRAIAEVLPKPQQRKDGYIVCGKSYDVTIVTWCVGHLLSLAEPDVYNPEFKRWSMAHLPIIPVKWQFVPKPEVQAQLKIVLDLIQQADEIIHAGDPDREGQLLVDEIFNYAQISSEKIRQIKRCLINDLTPNAVAKAIDNLQPNTNFVALSTSALARQRADWLYGINLTRYHTLLKRSQNNQAKQVFSVGRVQTPVLGLVVARDEAIKNFMAKDYFEVQAEIGYSSSANSPSSPSNSQEIFQNLAKHPSFIAKWQPSENCMDYADEEGRILSRSLAELVVRKITEQEATVTHYENKSEIENPPLPYSLSALQIEAGKLYGKTAQEVLDCCQRLYEVHKLITYPRSDCRYLPAEQFGQREKVLHAIQTHATNFNQLPAGFNLERKSRAWNSEKVEAHHGIIPTINTKPCQLSYEEQQIYNLIAQNFLAQFYPEAIYHKCKIELEIAGGKFIAQRRQLAESGWKALFKDTQNDEEESGNSLYEVKKGDKLFCLKGEVLSKKTTPPRPFTDATLLSAMTGIARFVEDSELKKILRQSDGLGTEATRASIIELLFKRQFLYKKGRNIHATETGIAHIHALPNIATKPDLTAHWERQLALISQQQLSYQAFMQELCQLLPKLVGR